MSQGSRYKTSKFGLFTDHHAQALRMANHFVDVARAHFGDDSAPVRIRAYSAPLDHERGPDERSRISLPDVGSIGSINQKVWNDAAVIRVELKTDGRASDRQWAVMDIEPPRNRARYYAQGRSETALIQAL